MPETLVALSIGSNLGDRLSNIEAMERELRTVLADVKASRLMETEPVGVSGHEMYLNKVVTGRYGGGVHSLLQECLSVESRLGRDRPSPKAPRTADVDILLFGHDAINEPPTLIVPHPELLNRRFCLEGLADIDPSIPIPAPPASLTVREAYDNMDASVAAQNIFFRT